MSSQKSNYFKATSIPSVLTCTRNCLTRYMQCATAKICSNRITPAECCSFATVIVGQLATRPIGGQYRGTSLVPVPSVRWKKYRYRGSADTFISQFLTVLGTFGKIFYNKKIIKKDEVCTITPSAAFLGKICF